MNTYRSDRRWAAVNLRLALPVGACAPVSATLGAGRSLATRSVVVGALSERLRGLRTNDGAASSSSSSSSAIRTSRRHFGAWLLSTGSVGAGEGSSDKGLFPATLSSVVGTGQACSSSLLVYRVHRTVSSSGGSSPAGFSIPGASDTYTVHRSTSPICNSKKDKSAAGKNKDLGETISK